MAWIALLVAGLLEILWAFFMKQSAGFTKLGPSVVTLVAMIASFALLSYSMRTLPLGTAYTIWTGIGAVGWSRLLAAALIVVGLVLMKVSTPS